MIYPRTVTPHPSKDDKEFSEDVIIYGEGLLNIGYYHYGDGEWHFHTDTLIDMKDVNFRWMYAPKELTNETD